MSLKKIILIGADHAGFALKEMIKKYLTRLGHDVADVTPVFKNGDDYPPIARAVAKSVAAHPGFEGILLCGSGFGMDIAANRVKGARAVVVRNVAEARLAKKDDAANILVLGGRITSPAEAKKIVSAWLNAEPSKAKRHVRRVKELG